MPRTLSRMTWPVANLSPGLRMFRIADVPAVHAHLFGEDVHDAFHGELRLVAAEAAHRAAVRDCWCRRPSTRRPRSARDTDRTCGTRHAARTCALVRVIAAGVSHDSRAHGQQMPLGIGAHGERDRHRMALDVVLRGLLAREHRLDRPCRAGTPPSPSAPESTALPSRRTRRRSRPARSRRPSGSSSKTLAICGWSYTEPWLSV